jgi:hypothetical protein
MAEGRRVEVEPKKECSKAGVQLQLFWIVDGCGDTLRERCV